MGGRSTVISVCNTGTVLCEAQFYRDQKHGIRLDGAYLDVFTCNEGDECDNPEHRMTRRECYEFRGRCFEYLLSQGILPSSEEVSDWAVESGFLSLRTV